MVRKLTIRETFESNRSVIDTLLNLGFEDNGTGEWSKYYPKDSFRVCIIPETGDCYISMNASSMEIDSRLKPVNTPESVSEIDRLANISFSKLSEPVDQYVSRMKKGNDFVNGVWVRKDAGKREAVSRKRSTRSSGTKANSVGRFLDNMIERGKLDEKQVTVVFDKNNNIMWLGKAGFYPLFMSNIEYRSSGYDADHPHEFWINARSYTTPFEESFKRNRVARNSKTVSMRESSMYDYFDVPDGAFDMHNDMPTEEDEMWSELSTKQREIINALEELGYNGNLTRFFSKIIGSWTKVYDTDKSTSSGVEVTVDLDGKVTVQEFVYAVDEEDVTDLSPVKVVKSATDVKKLDSWAKRIKKHGISL